MFALIVDRDTVMWQLFSYLELLQSVGLGSKLFSSLSEFGNHFSSAFLMFFIYLLFLFKILKEKDLANEKCKTTELQEIRSRLEKESAKLSEELRICKQEFEKVYWDKLSLHMVGYLIRNLCLLSRCYLEWLVRLQVREPERRFHWGSEQCRLD